MKNKYLEDLRNLLDDYQMDESEKTEIINDYSEMHDSWSDKGFNDDEVKKKLGHPRSIIKDLTEGYKKVVRTIPGSEKVIAISPFVASIIYFILGFGFDLWHPGWLIFILIPVVAIIMSMGKTKEDHLTTALSPFFATTIFLILGFGYDLWHPAWMVFLIIPVLGVWNSRYDMKKLDLLTALSPFITGLVYIILGMNGYWIEGWVVFMLIPMLGILNYPNKKMVFLWELLAIFSVVGYLYIGLTYDDSWQYAWITFIPFIFLSLLRNNWNNTGEIPKRYKMIIGNSTALFLLAGFFFDAWEVSWLFFLAIPVYAIITEAGEKNRTVALSPFVALVIFMLVGYNFDLWQFAWMIFIIIPVTAIVKNA